MKNPQGDHPRQRLPSLQKVRQHHGDQRHPVCLVAHHLPSHPWVHLYQGGRQVQQVQDYPRIAQYDIFYYDCIYRAQGILVSTIQ